MSPGSMRVCRNDTMAADCECTSPSSLRHWDSRAHLGIWPLARGLHLHSKCMAGTQQVHDRPATGLGTPTDSPGNGR